MNRGAREASDVAVRVVREPAPRASLTFDDGPDPTWTPEVLQALLRADARATFFVMGPQALRHPELVHAALEAGHGVEFHCSRHVRHTRASRGEIETDTLEGRRALESLGVEPRLWRPPWGVFAPWTEQVAASFGLEPVRWTADTHDWRGDPAPVMLKSIGPSLGPEAVVLMHDGLGPGALRAGCEETVALVEPLVARLRSSGLEPAPMSLSERGAVA